MRGWTERLSTSGEQARVMKMLRNACKSMVRPSSLLLIDVYGRDPYLILISCLLSLRTRDAVSFAASNRLFAQAKTPQKMVVLSLVDLEKLIYPVGFYRRKARQIHALSKQLIDCYKGTVPCAQDQLLSLQGVGRKTAQLVLGHAFDIPSICVDVHVHRISNALGWVTTKNPEETEYALKALFDECYWIELNALLVMWGQNICSLKNKRCEQCPFGELCLKNASCLESRKNV